MYIITLKVTPNEGVCEGERVRYVLQSVGLDDNNTHLSAIQYLHALLHTYILHILDTFHGVDNNRKRYDDDVRFYLFCRGMRNCMFGMRFE